MTTIDHYENGEWSERPDWTADLPEEDLNAALFAAGYRPGYETGLEFGASLVLWSSCTPLAATKGWSAYLVEISDVNETRVVSAATFRDAMDLMARWAPFVTASVLSTAYNDFLSSAENSEGLLTLLAIARADEAGGRIDAKAREVTRMRAERRRRAQEKAAARAAGNGGPL